MEVEDCSEALVEETELDKSLFFVQVLVVGQVPDGGLNLLRAKLGVEVDELPRRMDPDGNFGAVEDDAVRGLGDWQCRLVSVAEAVLAVEASFSLALSELLASGSELLLGGLDVLDLQLAGGVLEVVGPLLQVDDGALVLVQCLLVEAICDPERLFGFVLLGARGRWCARVHGWRRRRW